MYTGLQQAIDAAQPGDTILLRAGQTFTGNVRLRKKSGSGVIVIRSDAPDGDLPASGVRLVPSGRPGANTSVSRLARLRGYGGNWRTTPVIATDAGAANYRLMFLEIDGSAQEGYETLIALGNNKAQTSTAAAPYNLTFDRVYVHGHPVRGQKRCLALDSAKTNILNSYFADCKHFSSDAQAIAGFNGPGPFRIINNYLEASTENIMFGGADPKIPNLVPSDITIARNHFNKQLAWRNPILTRPSNPRASASSTSGVLAARTHYFKVVAVLISGGNPAVSAPSSEVSVSLSGSTTSATLSWAAVSGATRYRIYRGTSAGAENVYLQTPGNSTTFTYTGRSESGGKPPTSGTHWNVKNLIELKNAQRVTIEGNVIEHVWKAAQNGYALVFTPRNQDNTAPWTVVQDVTVRYNIVRHVNSGINILGYDYSSSGSQRTRRVNILHNVFADVGGAWGGAGRWIVITQSPTNVVVDHNTVFHGEHAVLADDGASTGFVFTNNLLKHNTYGILGAGTASGTGTLNTYFPGAVVKRNVLAGGRASSYPPDNYFPSVTEFFAQFVNYSGGNYRLISTSPYLGKATDGKAIGADIGALTAAQGGSAAPAPEPSPTNAAPTASAGGPYTGQVKTAISVNGSGSKDSDGTISSYRWDWGDGTAAGSGAAATHSYAAAGTYTITLTVTDNDGATGKATTAATISALPTSGGAGDIVLTSRDVTVVRGGWKKQASTSAAGGQMMQNIDQGQSHTDAPLASPRDYFEAPFQAAPKTSYRVWLRLRATSRSNDSVWVQFTGATGANGGPLWRTGTTKGLPVVLENCQRCGVSGWGWQKGAFWISNIPLVRFESGGPQTIRVQAREDGVKIDQIVLSPVKYLSTSPGTPTNDATILPRTGVALSARDIVLRSSDVVVRRSGWSLVSDGTAAGGTALSSPNNGWATPKAAYVTPSRSFDLTFTTVANVRYRVWLRLSAKNGSGTNDSVWLQYTNALDSSGRSLAPIGTTSGVVINGEPCSGCGLPGWGWKDSAYWTNPGIVKFTKSGTQRLRIQTREDGARIDQVVISPERYLSKAPGASQNDRTWVRRDGTVTTY